MKIVNEQLEQGKIIEEDLIFNIHVESVSQITELVAGRILYAIDGKKYFDKIINGKLYLTYPLSVSVEIDINNVNSIGSLLWRISQAYKNIYEEEISYLDIKKQRKAKLDKINGEDVEPLRYFGIWGHGIGDLYFERLYVYDNGLIQIGIGS